nr:hypothetical protein NeseNPV-TR_ORF37 [Neodiprion sertifer nucleopolyhedrovirus]
MEYGAIIFGVFIISAAIFDTPLLYVILCVLTVVIIYKLIIFHYTKDIVNNNITIEDKKDLKQLFSLLLENTQNNENIPKTES